MRTSLQPLPGQCKVAMRAFLSLLALCLSLSAMATVSFAQDISASIQQALSGYHETASLEDLLEAAGSEDALVEVLLELRTASEPPFVAIRAEKALLALSHREDVAAALLADIDSEQIGLARTIVAHIDSVPSSQLRQSLARRALARSREAASARGSSPKLYTQSLKESADAAVRQMAQEQP